MGVWDRFSRLIKSNINSMISKAENPEKTLNQLVLDMNQQLIEAKKSVATSISDEKRLERQLQGYESEINKWNERAMLAVKAGQTEPDKVQEFDNLARESLKRVKELEPVLAEARQNYERQHAQVESLKSTLRDLQQKIEDAQRKKNILISRARRAEAQKKIQDQITGISNTSAFSAFEELEKKVDEMEIQADTLNSISNMSAGGDLESKFKALESGTHTSLETDLQRLKNDAKVNLENNTKQNNTQQNDTQSGNQAYNSNQIQQFSSMDPDLEKMMNELKNKAKDN